MANKTRDLESIALRQTLLSAKFQSVLEIGCGTGKNTEWLCARADHVTAVDFSAEMLGKAKEKILVENVKFCQADITGEWSFAGKEYDLITCSLVLEHISSLHHVFAEGKKRLHPGGVFYIGELHPFRQYQGSKARFETGGGMFELECFVHHVSDFFRAARENGFMCLNMNEWFDEDDRTSVPRLITMVLRPDKP